VKINIKDFVIPPVPLVIFGIIASSLLFLINELYEGTVITATAKDISCNADGITPSKHPKTDKTMYLNIYCVTKHIKISDTDAILTYALNKNNTKVTCRSHAFGIDNCKVEVIK